MDSGTLFIGFVIGLASAFAVTLMLATILTHDSGVQTQRSASDRKK
jgi:hypothetical protein